MNMLSANFRWTIHGNDFDVYVRSYADQGLCSVALDQIAVITRDADYALIEATMLYYKGDGCAASPLALRFPMTSATDRPSWLIDRVEL